MLQIYIPIQSKSLMYKTFEKILTKKYDQKLLLATKTEAKSI